MLARLSAQLLRWIERYTASADQARLTQSAGGNLLDEENEP
jgi:hypothetical protein